MADASNQARLDQLLARVVDETATDGEIHELEGLLSTDPAARKRYVHYLDLHAELDQRCSSIPSTVEVKPPQEQASLRRGLSGRSIAAMAAVLLVAMGVWWALALRSGIENPPDAMLLASELEPTDDSVALLLRASDVVWRMDQPPLAGGNLLPGRLKLVSGSIQIEFFSGAVVTLEGPADFELVSANRAVCRQGRLRALVPAQARGFTIASPNTELVDLGTEFGMDVPAQGPTDIHVFEGEVDLFPASRTASTPARRVTAGQAMRVRELGEAESIAPEPGRFAALAWEDPTLDQAAERGRQWRDQASRLRVDPRIAVFYDFEPRVGDLRTLHDQTPAKTAADGAIVGCNWTTGRWPGKSALEFRRSGDRVRCDIPGQFDTMTLTAWVRVDSLGNRLQGLLLTDGYEVGRPHWQINPDGELRLGVRLPDVEGRFQPSGYGAPAVFDSRRMGVWTLIATVYDRPGKRVRHSIDGVLVREHSLVFDQPLHLGLAEIGNWGVPYLADRHPIRNFNGCIDELTIWNVALEQAEIARLYQTGRP